MSRPGKRGGNGESARVALVALADYATTPLLLCGRFRRGKHWFCRDVSVKTCSVIARGNNGPLGRTDCTDCLVEDALQTLLSESGALDIFNRSDVSLHLHPLGIVDRVHSTV